MTVLKIVYLLLAIYLLLTSVIMLSKSQRWWVRVHDYPRVQIAALSLLVAALALLPQFRSTINLVVAGLLVAAVLFQLGLILPYTPIWHKQTKDARNRVGASVISLLISNVRQDNRDYSKLIRLVDQQDPDVLLLIETDQAWALALVPLNERYPYSIQQPMPNHFGIMLFSRFPLLDSRVAFLRENHIPSIHTGILLRNGIRIMFHGVHPAPPAPGSDTDERDSEILQIARWVADSDTPSLVAGDLNDVAWSHTTRLFGRLSRMSDPRIGRGFFNTYNAFIPLLRFPLDHIFHTPHFRLVKLKRLEHISSDHFPILVVLSYEPDPENLRHLPQASRSDQKEAKRKINDQ